jgi:hypothetical protein
MADPKDSQKQIAGGYQGNLTLYRRINPRRLGLFLICFLGLAASIAAIIAFQKRGNEKFFNPGELSRNHANLPKGCADCHDDSFIRGRPTSVSFRQNLNDRFHRGINFESIDQHCAKCHDNERRQKSGKQSDVKDLVGYNFHQLNVVKDRSCTVCHPEHQGLARLDRVASSQCAFCHNNADTMEAAREKSKQINWDNSERHPFSPQLVVFRLPRPTDGFTKKFANFWDGHPEFQLKRQGETQPDRDVLKFNHQRHFAPDIPPLKNNKKLECSDCHQPDAQGRFNQPITFAQHCQVCHALQFDPQNPDLTLPHGDTAAVRGFLQDLQAHYADLALRKGLSDKAIQNFVTQQMMQLRDRLRPIYPAIPANLSAIGAAFEQQVFYVADPYKPRPGTVAQERASFYGCKLCHDPQSRPGAAPFIAKPVLVERWMPQSPFDHAKHKMVACEDCHHAKQSQLTSDVLMPGIEDCKTCHSPKGKVVGNQRIIAAAECTTCHTYHAPAALTLVQTNTR